MVPAQKVSLSRLDADTAARMLAGLERRDPRGIATPQDVIDVAHKGGTCFALTDATGGQIVYVLAIHKSQAWIHAAVGQGGADMTAVALPVIERQALGEGLHSVGFLTARPGLVRKAEKHGYSVKGWLLTKDLQ